MFVEPAPSFAVVPNFDFVISARSPYICSCGFW